MSSHSHSPFLEGYLNEIFQKKLDGFNRIVSIKRLTEGANSLMYKLEIEFKPDSGRPISSFCLRLTDAAAATSLKNASMEMEADIISAAARNGVPVPRVELMFSKEDKFPLDCGHMTEWLDGETLGSKVIAISKKLRNQRQLAGQCGQILARIHSIDFKKEVSSKTLQSLKTLSLEGTIADLLLAFRACSIVRPGVEFIFHWLNRNIAGLKPLDPEFANVLVHGDFRNGNLMTTERNQAGIIGVLDWELCHIGDLYSDLAWVCLESWRFQNHDFEVGGFGAKSDLIDSYVKHMNRNFDFGFDAQRFKIWEIVSGLKWCVICLGMGVSWLNSKAKGEPGSLERASIARRATESELDCLRKILQFSHDDDEPLRLNIPRSVEVKFSPENLVQDEVEDTDNNNSFLSSDDLLQAVKDFLRGDKNSKPDHNSYIKRVAVNVLSIVQREIELKQVFEANERLRLESVLNCNNNLSVIEMRKSLIAGMQSKPTEFVTDFVAFHLLLSLIEQMSIDQPKYAGVKSARDVAHKLFAARIPFEQSKL